MNVLPEPQTWNRAVQHSQENPTHILGPYEDDDGNMQMDCSCGFDTASPDNRQAEGS